MWVPSLLPGETISDQFTSTSATAATPTPAPAGTQPVVTVTTPGYDYVDGFAG